MGTFVSVGNLDLLEDAKRRKVEEKMADMIKTAKTMNIPKEELIDMMDILYQEEYHGKWNICKRVEQEV